MVLATLRPDSGRVPGDTPPLAGLPFDQQCWAAFDAQAKGMARAAQILFLSRLRAGATARS